MNKYNLYALVVLTVFTRAAGAGGSGSKGAIETPTTQTAISPNSAESKKTLEMGTALNMAASGLLITQCVRSKPNNLSLCAMGLAAAAQALANKQGADQSGNVNMQSSGWDIPKDDPQTTPAGMEGVKEGTTLGGFKNDKVQQALKALKDAGYQMDEKGLTSPDGTFTPAGSLGSSSALSAAGMSASSIQEAQKVLASVNQELSRMANVSPVGVVESGGGYSYSSSSGSDGDSMGMVGSNKPFLLNAGQKQALMAGKTVMFQGEPIGVPGRNIFDMMRVAYERRSAKNLFVDSGAALPSNQGPVVRTPASASKPTARSLQRSR